MPTNRVVALATAILALALGVLPVIADMDWTSTAGIIAGLIAVLGVVAKWLEGWQRHEEREAYAVSDDLIAATEGLDVRPSDPASLPPDEGDATAAAREGAPA